MSRENFYWRIFLVVMVALVLVGGAFAGVVEAREGGDLLIGIGTDPESLDPIEASSSPAAMVMLHVVEPLFDMTEDGEIVPLLAEGYEADEEGKVFDIFLKEGITFHDGSYFNAEVVKFNLERMIEEEAPFSFLIDSIDEIEVVDDYTVRLKMEEPFAPIIAHLSHNFVSMVSPEAVEEYGEDFAMNIVGTGPFVFEEWTRGEEVILSRNDDYWGDKAYVDTVTFKIIPEDSTRVVMLETGEIHAAMRVPPRDSTRLADNEDLSVVETSSLRTIYIGMHNQREPFNDVRVRQAVNYAVDKESIVYSIMDGAGRPSDAPISPDIFGYFEQEKYEYNPDRARELLAEAGYEDGLEVSFHYPAGRYMMDETIAQAVQSQLADVGITANLINLEWAAYLDMLEQAPEDAEHDMYLLGWGTVTGDADYGLYALFHSSQWAPAGNDYSYLGHDRVDELLHLARVTPDEESRLDYYEEVMALIWEEAPWLFLHSEVQIDGVSNNVAGLIHHPRENIIAREAYFVE